MSTSDKEQKFLQSVRNGLDNSCDRLNAQTLSRLNAIRHAALDQQNQGSKLGFMTPFSGAVSACTILLMFFFWQHNDLPVMPTEDSEALQGLDILISADAIEFYEDYEFYRWLDDNDPAV